MDRPQKAFDPCLDTGEVGEGPVVESPIEAVRDKAAGGVEAIIDKAGEAVEVIDKVEEPGVDAKVVEGWIADIDPDLARSQLLEEIRRPEETKAESPAEAKKLLPQGLLLEPKRPKVL